MQVLVQIQQAIMTKLHYEERLEVFSLPTSPTLAISLSPPRTPVEPVWVRSCHLVQVVIHRKCAGGDV